MNKIFTANTLLAAIGVVTGLYVCEDHFVIGAVIIGLTFAVVVGAQIIEHQRIKKTVSTKKLIERKVSKITHDRMYEMPVAIAITSDDGRVLMTNRLFVRQFGKQTSKTGTNFAQIIGIDPKKVKADGTFHELNYEDHAYLMSVTEFFRAEKRKLLFHLFDITQIKNSEAHYHHSRTILGYIQIDNYEDLSESLSPQCRTELFAQIDVVLNRWAQHNGVVLQKFENSHYLMVFSHDDLEKMEADHFRVLDEVRELSKEGGAVSLSIGIEDSEEHSTLPEAEEGSRSALDIALARGGDQCVVRKDDHNIYYGGETEAKEKRTKVKARVKALLRRYCVYRGKEQSGSGQDSILSLGRIRLNRMENQVWVRGREVDLTGTEYRILRLLMEHPHRFFSPGQVYERVWGKPDPGPTRPVMVHIRNLRTKIEEDPSQPQYLKTAWGKGYRFEVSRHRTKA